MRPKLIAGNWKMHKTVQDAVLFIKDFSRIYSPRPEVEVAVAPPFITLQAVRQAIGETSIQLAAQNLYWADEGAYTGEISPPMLREIGCKYVIVGHSERRQLFGEGNELINQKVCAALRHGLFPILCVGELAEERDSGLTESVVGTQLLASLKDLTPEQVAQVTIAYEPVWAIGTGRAATVDQAAEVHKQIRLTIKHKWAIPENEIRVLYGGSVSQDNAKDLFSSPEINGALIGKACLNPESFATIIFLAL
jgi:triosephosphate isomerase